MIIPEMIAIILPSDHSDIVRTIILIKPRWQSCRPTPLEELIHQLEKIKKHPILTSMVGAAQDMLPSFFSYILLLLCKRASGPWCQKGMDKT